MRTVAENEDFDALIETLAEAIGADVGAGLASNEWAIVGIRSRGDVIAERLAEVLGENGPDHVGVLDITLYRDDLSEVGPQAIVGVTEIDFSLEGISVVLVDDVLMSGRSVRAALQYLGDLGRPRRVWLSVLVDRGGRELPIRADHVAVDLSDDLESHEYVEVAIRPTDEVDAVRILSAMENEPLEHQEQ